MHTYEQVIKRIDEIVQMVNEIPADRINMDAWVTMHDDSECGSICCVLGWAASKQMFGMHLRTSARLDQYMRTRPVMVPVIDDAEEFVAGRRLLFGDLRPAVPIEDQAYIGAIISRIADGLFQPIALSIYDSVGSRRPRYGDDQRQVFLDRIPRVKHEIRQLYNILEGSDSEFCRWDSEELDD